MTWIAIAVYVLAGAAVVAGYREELADVRFSLWQRVVFGLFVLLIWPAVVLVGEGD